MHRIFLNVISVVDIISYTSFSCECCLCVQDIPQAVYAEQVILVTDHRGRLCCSDFVIDLSDGVTVFR